MLLTRATTFFFPQPERCKGATSLLVLYSCSCLHDILWRKFTTCQRDVWKRQMSRDVILLEVRVKKHIFFFQLSLSTEVPAWGSFPKLNHCSLVYNMYQYPFSLFFFSIPHPSLWESLEANSFKMPYRLDRDNQGSTNTFR